MRTHLTQRPGSAASRQLSTDHAQSPRQLRQQSRVRASQASRLYESQLRKVGRIIGRITETSPVGDLERLLRAYAEALIPWAERTALRMLLDIDDATARTWRTLAENISFERRQEISYGMVSGRLRELLAEQVTGITSIPIRAAERVEKLAAEALVSGERAREIKLQIQAQGKVSETDAMRLARTSVSGAATALMQSRAEQSGSPGYIWETSRDATVRPEHRKLQGQFIRWDDPPTIDGYTAHAGQFANCRCWARPVLEIE